MPTDIQRDEAAHLVALGAQLAEVLPEAEYEQEHLPGAVNVPLKRLNAETTRQLRRDRPLIAYCHDVQ